MGLVVFGVGGHLSSVMETALASKLNTSLVVMNVPETLRPRTTSIDEHIKLFPGPPKVIQLDEFEPEEGERYFLGTTATNRHELVEHIRARFGVTCCTLVHPLAYVSSRASLASGVYIGAFCTINSRVRIGEQASIHARAHVAHDTSIGAYARLFAGCNVAGNVEVGEGATVGMGATIIEELQIGAGAYIAAGAAVTEDVPPRVLVAGVPARIKKSL
jgi:acetyltransferase EpsM